HELGPNWLDNTASPASVIIAVPTVAAAAASAAPADSVDDTDRLSQAAALRAAGQPEAALSLLASLLDDAGNQSHSHQQHQHSRLALATPRAMRLSAEILFESGDLQAAKEFLHAEKMYYNAEVACADQLIRAIDSRLAEGCPTSILRSTGSTLPAMSSSGYRVRFANSVGSEEQQQSGTGSNVFQRLTFRRRNHNNNNNIQNATHSSQSTGFDNRSTSMHRENRHIARGIFALCCFALLGLLAFWLWDWTPWRGLLAVRWP
ncbi:hypothetical protein BOX15_Mlig003841g3, partial [Macrostomum lignano]